MKVYRLEHTKSRNGFYRHLIDDSVKNASILHRIREDVSSILPTPVEDFEKTYGEDDYDNRFAFIDMLEKRSTKYAFSTLDQAKAILRSIKDHVGNLQKLGFQFVEYDVEKEYVFELNEQVMYNSKHAIKSKTLHLNKIL